MTEQGMSSVTKDQAKLVCPVCGSREVMVVESMYGWCLWQCDDCGQAYWKEPKQPEQDSG